MAQRKLILLLSGEIGSGKTTLALQLEREYQFKILRTREILDDLASKKARNQIIDRSFLQKLGANLDDKESGRWVLNFFQKTFSLELESEQFYVVDSIRTLKQIEHFRKAYSYSVFHLHLTASPECLQKRFLLREEINQLPTPKAAAKYSSAKNDDTEKNISLLGSEADVTINTQLCGEKDVLVRTAAILGLLPSTCNQLVDVVVGGQFGSEGKGHIVAHLAREYDCLVRVGGPNAGHSVYEEPAKHVFHQLPSGSYRNQSAKLLLAAGSVINVDKLIQEIKQYRIDDELEGNNRRLIIDENATVISSNDIDFEAEVKNIISSTGQGVGAATAKNIIARLYGHDAHKAKNHPLLKPYIGSTQEELYKLYKQNKKILIEGTQGSGLSLHHGVYPFVTSRDTTVTGCLSETGISPKHVNKIVMVVRTYPIRVGGTSGPFYSDELDFDIIADRSGQNAPLLKELEKTTTTKKQRRIAEFSWYWFRKACELNSPTDIALTFTDYISKGNEKARRYEQLTSETREFIQELEICSGSKVSLISTCFDYRSIIDRRNWR